MSTRPQLSSAFFLAALLVASAVITVYATDLCVTWGINIPQEDLHADYALGALWALVLGLTIFVWPVPAGDKSLLAWGWLGKCAVTLLVMLPYEAHYDLDEFGYFFQSRLSDYVWNSVEGKRGHTTVVWLAWLQERFIDSFHALKVSYSMMGLVAIYLFYRALILVVPVDRHRIFYWIAFFPSIIFWSSILGKDPIVFLGVALYFYGVVKMRATRSPLFLIVAAAGITIAAIVRYWLGLILVLPLVVFAMVGFRSPIMRIIVTAVAAGGFVYVLSQFASGMGIAGVEELPTVTADIARRWSAASTREVHSDFSSLGLMFAFLPIGIFTVLFRPLPGEVLNLFGTLAGMENVVVLSGAWRILSHLRVSAVRKQALRNPILVWSVSLVLVWSALYGFVSFQNLGAAVRFRLPILAVVIGIFFLVESLAQKIEARQPARIVSPIPIRPVLVADSGAES